MEIFHAILPYCLLPIPYALLPKTSSAAYSRSSGGDEYGSPGAIRDARAAYGYNVGGVAEGVGHLGSAGGVGIDLGQLYGLSIARDDDGLGSRVEGTVAWGKGGSGEGRGGQKGRGREGRGETDQWKDTVPSTTSTARLDADA